MSAVLAATAVAPIADCLPNELPEFLPLFRELNDLKRLYAASCDKSVSFATHTFEIAWQQQLQDDSRSSEVALASRAIAAARLGFIDEGSLFSAGLGAESVRTILLRSVAEHGFPALTQRMHFGESADASSRSIDAALPWWVEALARQPRAGATCPGKPRLVLEPAENHADHCLIVALYGWMLAPAFGADPSDAWLVGLAHHFHNATLPDSGWTGEMLLGGELDRVIANLRDLVLAELPRHLGERGRELLREIAGNVTPLARCFHAADSIDRVLQMEHFEKAANFTVKQATHDLQLVHEGPSQQFQVSVLRAIGLL